MTNAAVVGCASGRLTSLAAPRRSDSTPRRSVHSPLGSRGSGSGGGGLSTKNFTRECSFSFFEAKSAFTDAATTTTSGSGGGDNRVWAAVQLGSRYNATLAAQGGGNTRGCSTGVRAESGSAASPPAEEEESTETNLEERTSEKNNNSNNKGFPWWVPMHDFCLTLPWGLFVALGGVAGFAIAGSTKSLIFGGGFGALLMVLGGLSLKKWKAGGSSTVYTASSLFISAALSFVMGKKWLAGSSFIPSGLITVGVVFMCVSYVHNMLTGGNPPRSKRD